MRAFPEFLKKATKKIAYVFVAGIIILAILVGVSRLFVPELDTRRADFEKWASDLLATPVKIEKIHFSWHQYQPEISLDQVTVLGQETKEPILQIRQVSIFFSIAQSIWQRKPVPSSIMVTGTNINAHETAEGEIVVQGFPAFGGFNSKPFEQKTKFNDIMTWLSTQPRLSLQAINVSYTKFNNQTYLVTLHNLNIINSNTQHTILGKAILHQQVPTEVTMTIKWLGEKFDLAQIRASVYLYVSGFSLTQWFKGFKGLKDYSLSHWQITDGIGSAKIWASWNHGEFHKIQTTFETYNLSLYSLTDKSTHKINRLSGNLGWKREGKTQVFAGDDILVDLPSHLWPATSFYISLEQDVNGVFIPKAANIGYIDLSDAQRFLFSSSLEFSESTRKMLAELKLSGALQNAAMTFSEPGPWTDLKNMSFNANFSQLSFSPWQKMPGVSNLSGLIKWNGTQGNLSLHSNRVIFRQDSVFANTIPIDQLSGDVEWKFEPSHGWMLSIPSLQILNGDTAANINGSITVPTDLSPIVDLNANFTMQRANQVARYLPLRIFDPELVEWLQKAFLSGEVHSGTATVRGRLADFPFDQNKGTFLVAAKVNKIDLRFAPDWPILKNTTGKLTFSGRKMLVDVEQAQLFDIPVNAIHAEIPYLGDAEPQVLHIKSGEIQANFAQALKFVHASPLEKKIGKIFSAMDIQGPLLLKLGLTIPLKNPDQTQVKGNLIFKETRMNVTDWKLVINDLGGEVEFTENSTNGKNISGQLFRKPLTLNLSTLQKSSNNTVIRASVATHLNISDLDNWLKIPFSNVAKGSTDVNADIDFAADAPVTVHLSSNLVGLTLDLPEQYAKKAHEARDFSADIIAEEKQPLQVRLNYGKLLGAALVLDRKQDKFSIIGANLQLGTGAAAWPTGSGLYLTGNFDQLDWDTIKGYMGQSSSVTLEGLTLRGVDIKANVLNLFGQRLTQVQIQVTPSQNNWMINVNSPDVVGQIQTPVNITSKGFISAQFQKFNLRAAPDSKSTNSGINVNTLPSLSFVANNASYNNIPLGQITFKVVPSGNGLTIQTLQITSPRMELQATGEWTSANMTRLRGTITSENVSDLMKSLGMDAHNLISSNGRLNFDLTWHNPPYAPSVASLNGSASLNLGKGRIVDVGEASGTKMDIGRMLSIFSLQTIPRRLSFDFSDVFQKGYSFDYVRGDFTFHNGNANTSNLRFDGPVARIDINGRIGLSNKDYDFILSVTPYVTSSLPVAAAVLTGPVGGVAALAVSTVIGSAVSKVVTYYYAVTGPWDNPSWQTVGSPGRR